MTEQTAETEVDVLEGNVEVDPEKGRNVGADPLETETGFLDSSLSFVTFYLA